MVRTNGKGKTAMSEKRAGALYEKVIACRPLLTKAAMWECDKLFMSQDFGIGRRCALGVATMGGPFFKEFENDREKAVLMAGVLSVTGDQIRILKHAVDVFERVQARLMVALAVRPDMDAVIADGEKTLEREPS